VDTQSDYKGSVMAKESKESSQMDTVEVKEKGKEEKEYLDIQDEEEPLHSHSRETSKTVNSYVNSKKRSAKSISAKTNVKLLKQFAPDEPLHLPVLVATHPLFDLVVTAVICVNAVVIGVEADLHSESKVASFIFTLLFTIEMVVKLMAFRQVYFYSGWNVFDCFLVVTSVIDAWIVPATGGDAGVLSDLSILRILRMVRIVRLVRIIRFVEPLAVLLAGIMSSMKPLFWVALLTILILYAFGVFGTIYFGHDEGWEGELKYNVHDWFGTVPRSMFTLFQIMTLESWANGIVRPIMEEKPESLVYFLSFILLTTFAFLNMITGVIVENTMKASAENEKKTTERKTIMPVLLGLLGNMDVNGDGLLSGDEMTEAIKNPEVFEDLSEIGVSMAEFSSLYEIYDKTDDGAVEYKEFVASFFNLNEDVTRKELLVLQASQSRSLKRIVDIKALMTEMQSNLSNLNSFVRNGPGAAELLSKGKPMAANGNAASRPNSEPVTSPFTPQL